ncbi:MAG: hypothetical protein JWO87_3396 [Phycisphaerales bacterium]|jgi:hypothetical protein|nr:hypothetical protein [Phycisphaerales bacterium]MDB5301733.1 hypothetical protein [Phycisphaerales bacterium]MDB5303211.1 hypothetical protein [Phycisphaerales bacterium]
MLRQQKTGALGGSQAVCGTEEAALTFDPAALVRGIAYHVLDEGLARGVSDEAMRRTLERLAARSVRASIPRSRWAALANAERLDWLLSQSQTFLLVGPGNIMLLRARRGR